MNTLLLLALLWPVPEVRINRGDYVRIQGRRVYVERDVVRRRPRLQKPVWRPMYVQPYYNEMRSPYIWYP